METITKTRKKTTSPRRSAARPLAPSSAIETRRDRAIDAEDITDASMNARPLGLNYHPPQTFNLKDIKRQTAQYTARENLYAVIVAILGTAVVFLVIWLLWFALGA